MAKVPSNTMELNAILEEARTRKNGGVQQQTPAKAPARQAQQRPAAPRQQAPARQAPARQARSIEDDFIFTDDYGRQVPRGSAPRSSGYQYQQPQPPKKKGNTGLIVTLSIVGVIVVAAAAVLVWLLFFNNKPDAKSDFADNVTVNGKSLKGLSMDEARALMKGVEEELANGIKVDFNAGGKTVSFNKNDFEYTFDTEQVLAEAQEYSESNGFKTEEKKFEITMTIKDTTADAVVSKVASTVKTEPKNATVTKFDPAADSMFTVSDETQGVSLNEDAARAALKKFISEGKTAGTIEAPVEAVDPEYTAAFLKANIKKLSSYSTTSTNNANGNENMRISLAACNGSIIEPGATWSFNDCTGNSNLESNGYKPAGVLIQGRSETGVGGGICQSSTTIYNAGILCGMEVVERQPHYYKSVYVEAGRDATVDYGNIDLRMKNPFKYQLFMKCWMDGVELNCVIYGLENPDFDSIEITTTAPTYFDNGYRVNATRHYYKDGSEVKTDELPSSTYYTSAPSSGSSGSSGGSSGDDDDDSGSSSGGDNGGDDGGDDGGGDSGGDDGGGDDGGGGDNGGDDGGGEEGGGEEGGE